VLWFQLALQEGMMVAWNRWKYPLTLTLFFLLIYGFLGILDPTPSVDLPEDIRLLLNDRQRFQLPDFISSNVSVIVEQNIQAVVASELWFPAENTNLEENIRSQEVDQAKDKPDVSQRQVRDRISLIKFSDDSDIDRRDRKRFDRWLDQREIIGNERFVHRFQSGIQKPEDFYERNRDTVVKIQRREHISTTTETPTLGEDDLFTHKPKGREGVTSSLSPFTARSAHSVTEKRQRSQIYADIQNSTLPRKTKRSNLSTGLGHVMQKRPNTRTFVDKAEVRLRGKTEPTPTSEQLVQGRLKDGVRNTSSSRSGSRRQLRKKSTVNGTSLADLKSAPYPPVIVNATGAFCEQFLHLHVCVAV